ncbi:hypothetical protein K2173_010426 [Erythroxylum novogranatense]|uniref:Amino acid transporter transmembrane domain-containing protein n=1 Tax=Erythroxylum novogranatense TaxID=1862640 RepID=A0AAV8TDS5_9ROSI|nr:hypothetical protein K2173_010426 [Erythroxylum novogranatense]
MGGNGDVNFSNDTFRSPNPLLGITIEASSSRENGNTGIQGNGSETNLLEAWLPLTESRNGSICSSIFHLLSSGIGVQALLLPVAYATLGWTWGTICLVILYLSQLYTTWLLVQLHESFPGPRNSRFLLLAFTAFGPKLGKLLAIFPVMYLSGGTCVILIITAGGTLKLFLRMICEDGLACNPKPLTGVEWFLVFVCVAIVIAQRPNLHSISGISLIGTFTAIAYCTLLWALPVSKGRPNGVTYESFDLKSDMSGFGNVMNAIGLIALAFRGHNLVLEIQGTLPSNSKVPSRKPMWRAVMISYFIILLCQLPLAIAGYWAYGNQIPSGGMLTAFSQFHGPRTSKLVKGILYLLIVISCLTQFQIYAMVVFDNLELRYVAIKNRPCPWWLRTFLRGIFGGLTFLIAVAFPFLPSLAPFFGGLALPLTFAYPCFMWIRINKQHRYDAVWFLNIGLGSLGLIMSILIVVAAIRNFVRYGLDANFFSP